MGMPDSIPIIMQNDPESESKLSYSGSFALYDVSFSLVTGFLQLL